MEVPAPTAKADRASKLGQSMWYDNISRDLLDSGELGRLIAGSGVRGVTSNPTIFQKAMSTSAAYAEQFEELAAEGRDAAEIYEALAVADIQRGADLLRGVYDESKATDGFISLEVSPALGNDTDGTIAEAKRLWAAVDRPNLMIKIPATPEGIPAIRAAIAAGINVNITLIFSIASYAKVIDAFMAGLEDRVRRGQLVDRIASVASFFVSRVDTAIDKLLDEKARVGDATPLALRGKAAIANAKLAYELFEREFGGPRFEKLRLKGAQVQRPLWASTSTKNPNYKDTIYVDALIGPHTVNTLPPATLAAFNDHGTVAVTIRDGLADAKRQIAQIEELGISLDHVCQELLRDGVASFAKSFTELLAAVEARRKEVPAATGGPFDFGGAAPLISATVDDLTFKSALSRIFGHDGRLWPGDGKVRQVCMNRLGWVHAPEIFKHRLAELYAFAEGVRQDGIRNVVLCGMGGSSLAPEVLATVFGPRVGFPRLSVLDSTSPDAILAMEASIDLASTLFVISSKSGTTIETECLRRHFTARLEARDRRDVGRHLTAITDPGSQLADIAEKEHWRAVFENPEDFGGRYAALSFFGLVPAALLGLDLERLLASAEREAAACRPTDENVHGVGPCEALVLGAAMGRLAKDGVDKMTLRSSPGIAPFGAWVEQLVAESTGKSGVGVLPVVDEPAGASASRDRFYVDLLLSQDGGRAPPTASDAPQATFRVRHPYELGALFYRFEMATALASIPLGVEPFDQPNVAAAKEATSAVLAGTAGPPESALAGNASFSVSAPPAVAEKLRPKLTGAASDPASWLRALLASASPGDYVALLAYVARNPSRTAALQEVRAAAGAISGAATTLGYGPCYLHSTGQLHKGGGTGGIFLLIEAPPPAQDLPIPGKPFTFGRLFHAQAEGDFRTLAGRNRRIVRVRLAGPADAALAALSAALRR